MKEEALLATLL
jgi:hypothetical protein